MTFFDLTAVGMRFAETEPGAHASELMELGEILLRPEPDNPHDPKAVLVCAPDGRPLAHVSRETLVNLPPLPAEGRLFTVHHAVRRGNAAILFALLFS